MIGKMRSCLACRTKVREGHKLGGIRCTIWIILGWDYHIVRASDWPKAIILSAIFWLLIGTS